MLCLTSSWLMSVYQKLVDKKCVYQSGQNGLPECQFVGISDNHLEGYANLDPIIPHVGTLNEFIGTLVTPSIVQRGEQRRRIGAFVTPATGSIPIATLAANYVMEAEGRDDVYALWGDKTEGEDGKTDFHFPRPGFTEALLEVLERGEEIWIAEDMINKQHSAKRIIRAVQSATNNPDSVSGVVTIAANRGVTGESLGVPSY